MEYGFHAPSRGPLATPDGLTTLAHRGEELGFRTVSVSDHVIIPRTPSSRYPYNETGQFAGQESGDSLEQLVTLSFLASATSRIRLLTSVMVLPHRSPVLTTKMLATIDVLSNGRLDVGCGVGWLREEFETLGAPPYDQRGAASDEYIRAFKALWTSDNPAFDGKYSRFANITFLPKPVQRPHPPLWIGGETPPALRRAAYLGDVWYPSWHRRSGVGGESRFPLGGPDQLAGYISRLHGYAEEAGRDPSEIRLAYSANWYNDRKAQTLSSGERRIFTGAPRQVVSDIKAFEELGVRHLMFNFQAGTLQETLENMDRFATEVRPLAED